jgi:hypothetical protein
MQDAKRMKIRIPLISKSETPSTTLAREIFETCERNGEPGTAILREGKLEFRPFDTSMAVYVVPLTANVIFCQSKAEALHVKLRIKINEDTPPILLDFTNMGDRDMVLTKMHTFRDNLMAWIIKFEREAAPPPAPAPPATQTHWMGVTPPDFEQRRNDCYRIVVKFGYEDLKALCRLCTLPCIGGIGRLLDTLCQSYAKYDRRTDYFISKLVSDHPCVLECIRLEVTRHLDALQRKKGRAEQRRSDALIAAATAAAASAASAPVETTDDVEATVAVISLVDHISLKRVTKPVRTARCKHPECFEYDTHIERFKEKSIELWRCPCCMAPAAPSELVRDGWFERVLAVCKENDKFAEYDVATGKVLRTFADKACGKRKHEGGTGAAVDLDTLAGGQASNPIYLDDD